MRRPYVGPFKDAVFDVAERPDLVEHDWNKLSLSYQPWQEGSMSAFLWVRRHQLIRKQ